MSLRFLYIIVVFPLIFSAQEFHRDLNDTKWNAPEILYARENPITLTLANEANGHFLEFGKDSSFRMYNAPPCGNDCFVSYSGKYVYVDSWHLILDFKKLDRSGECEEEHKTYAKNELKRDYIVRLHENGIYLYKGFGQPTGFVTDRDSLLTSLEEQILNQICKNHEKETTNEFCIVTVKGDIQPYKSITDYSLDLANYWGIGKKEKNNGITIAFSSELKELRIHVGHWLTDQLTDQDCKWIINSIMLPEFKKGNYFEGLKAGLNKIFDELK